jgi:hypothetical protein
VYTETRSKFETSFGVRKGCVGGFIGMFDISNSIDIEWHVLMGTRII